MSNRIKIAELIKKEYVDYSNRLIILFLMAKVLNENEIKSLFGASKESFIEILKGKREYLDVLKKHNLSSENILEEINKELINSIMSYKEIK